MSAFNFTIFTDLQAGEMVPSTSPSFKAFATSLAKPPEYPSKEAMPLLCPMLFNGQRTGRGAMRDNDFVDVIYGACGDHDAGTMSLATAHKLMVQAGVECVLYTTGRHTEAAPRWRVIVSLAKPTRDHGAHLAAVERMNHILQGALTTESFTLSQSFYFGRVKGKVYRTLYASGKCIDLVSGARRGSGKKESTKAHLAAVPDTDAQLIAQLRSGEEGTIHTASMRLLARYWEAGKSEGQCLRDVEKLIEALDIDPDRKATRIAELPRLLEGWIRKHPRSAAVQMVREAQRRVERTPDTDEPESDVVQRIRSWAPVNPSAIKPVSFYVEGLIEERRSVGLVAPGGTGKTTLLLDLAISTALGREWLGMVVKPGTFILLSLDDLQEDLDGALEEVMEAQRLAPEDKQTVRRRVRLISMLGTLATFAMETRDGGVIETALREDIERALADASDLRCLALDTGRQFAGGDTNSSRVMTLITQAVSALGYNLNCAVIVPHHMTKVGARSGEIDQYIGSGSAAFGDNLRVILSLRTSNVLELGDSISIDAGDAALLKSYQILRLDDTRGSLRRKTLPTIWMRRDGYNLKRVTGRALGSAERTEVQLERVIEAVRNGATSTQLVRHSLKLALAKATELVAIALSRGMLLKKNKTSPLSVPE